MRALGRSARWRAAWAWCSRSLSKKNFSPDGKLVVTGSEANVKIWDARTGAEVSNHGRCNFVKRGLDVIQKEAWLFYRTSSGVRLCWELEEPLSPEASQT